jgi:hypothetical protein
MSYLLCKVGAKKIIEDAAKHEEKQSITDPEAIAYMSNNSALTFLAD